MDCVLPHEENGQLSLIDEWAPKILADCNGPWTPGRQCNPEEISKALRETHIGALAHDACPILEGEEHDDEQDCVCFRSMLDNEAFLRTLPAMNCEIDEGKFLFDFAAEQLENCKDDQPVCNPEKIGHELMNTHMGQLALYACPILTGEKHEDWQDCNCANSIVANEDFLRHQPSMMCNMPMEGGRLVSIFEWAQITQGSCGDQMPVCNPKRIAEDIEGTWADGAAQEMCPITAGRAHTPEDDCRCAQALHDHG